MHLLKPPCDSQRSTSLIKTIKGVTFLVPLLLLSSCVDPYSSLYGESPEKIKQDVDFLQGYEKAICDIREKHEYGEITRGKCLAQYFDFKEQSHIKNEQEAVAKRVRYVMEDPGKIDQSTLEKLSVATAKIGECKDYIKENCM